MQLTTAMHLTGAAVTAGLGLMGLARPAWVAAFTSIAPRGATGMSEVRATYGGFFLALGGYALLSQHPVAFTTAGVAWLGAAVGRAISVVTDRSTEPRNLAGIVFEAVIGGALVAG